MLLQYADISFSMYFNCYSKNYFGVSTLLLIIQVSNKRHKTFIFIINLIVLDLDRYQPSAILSTFLSITLRYNLLCFSWTAPTSTGWSSQPCSHNAPTLWWLLPSSTLLPQSLCLRHQAWDLKLCLPLFYAATSHRHLHSYSILY